jgi:ABC-type sugar transport system ATPase subunit
MISNIGSDKFIHARTGKSSFTVRVPKEVDFRAGQIITLKVDPNKVHVFCNGCRI